MRTLQLHPLHPALAHFPLAFWIGASLCDLIALKTHAPLWWTLSHHAMAAGLIAAVATVFAGLLELWLRHIPPASRVWLLRHAILMGSAFLCFMVSLAWRVTIPPPQSAVIVGLAGTTISLVGAYCGGALVYRYGVGVMWRPDDRR